MYDLVTNKPAVSVLEAEIEGFRFLQLSATQAGELLGTATVYWLGIDGKTPELCNLYVADAARRQGVAQALIAAAQRAVGGPMVLHTVRKSPAYWLYRKLGFTEIGPVKGKRTNWWMLVPAYV